MSGTTDKISGKTKQVVGKATDNEKLQAEGKAQEVKGNVKQTIKTTGEKVADKVDHSAQKLDR
jgi:uncharacterized protein YjbJ (UPF0337 family)